jgi:hypothetical protein
MGPCGAEADTKRQQICANESTHIQITATTVSIPRVYISYSFFELNCSATSANPICKPKSEHFSAYRQYRYTT